MTCSHDKDVRQCRLGTSFAILSVPVRGIKDTVASMVAAIPVITIKDEENEFDASVGNEEY